MKKGFTKIAVVLDRSGSMESVKSATIEGLNSFINEQKRTPGECDLHIAQFDTEYETVYAGRVHDAPTFNNDNYHPRGGTALYDAIGRTVDALGTSLSWMSEDSRPDRVLIAIITDGYENSSHKYSGEKIGSMIGHQRDTYQWNFIFIGANQDAILSAAKIGIGYGQTLTYNASNVGTQNMMRALTNYTTTYRDGSVADPMSISFLAQDREDAMQADK